jgi:multidrug resistance efflux pump
MDGRRGVSALGRKVRLMRRPQDASNNFRNPRPSRSPGAELSLDLPSPKVDDVGHLETQKKLLMTKLSQISQDYANEEQKRKKLEEEVVRARSRASGVFQQTVECEELRDRLKVMQAKLDGAQSKYSANLDTLAGLRTQLDQLRRERITRHGSAAGQRTGDEEAPRTIGHITDSEKAALIAHQKGIEKFTRVSAVRRTQVTDPTIEEIVNETDRYQTMIQKILDALQMNSLPEVFTEAERLEKENREMYMFLVENDEVRRNLIDEINALGRQYEELSAAREEKEQGQKQKVEKLNADIIRMQEQLRELQAQKAKQATEFSVVYSAIEELFQALHCSWEGAPDGALGVTGNTAIFALGAIDAAVAELTAGKLAADS